MMTYLDMLIRGRPASKLPEEAAGRVLEQFEEAVPVAPVAESPQSEDKNTNRRAALGTLLGYATGLSIGGLYGIAVRQERADGISALLAGSALGIAAMAATDAPMMKMGLTDPRTWSRVDWLADLVPHLGYGMVTAGVYRSSFTD